MENKQQVFQTSSRLRWFAFKWVFRLFLFFLFLMIPVVWIAMTYDSIPMLPGLSKEGYEKINPVQMKGFSKKEKRKYRGYEDFLKLKKQNTFLAVSEKKKKPTTSRIRAAFYVDWDPQASYSLENHISKLNTVLPEWFFIDPVADTLVVNIDKDAYTIMKKHGIIILPMLNNVNLTNQDGRFDGKLLSEVLNDKTKRNRLLSDILKKIDQYKFQGINIDFEEMQKNSVEAEIAFQKELYNALHKRGLLVTQDVMPEDESYHLKELGSSNDFLFIMAYNQHFASSDPGPVSEQRWIEKELDVVSKMVPSNKIVLCLAAYGYDWPEGDMAEIVTYQQALSLSKEFNAPIDFDNDSYNCSFEYTDYEKVHHKVSFLDAGGNFNTMRFADESGTAGVALWRLGSEDDRLWSFYNRDLSNAAIEKIPFDFSLLSTIDIVTGKPDYKGDGEILDVKNGPQKGFIDIEKDSVENLVSEEYYRQLPTRYFIKRYGQVHNEVILTFDDGPDPEYTPRILDILEKEKVPAAFFVVGMNAEAHLPILKRIYREGFEIGNHTFTHPNIATVSDGRAQTEIEATRLLIEAATGRSTILFRAPYNADAEPTKAVELKPLLRSKLQGYYTVGESIDPDDWDTEHGTNADSVYNRVVRLYEAHPDKGIILFHDAGGNRDATVGALPRIIHYFKSKNIKFTTVANLLGLSKDIIMPPVHNELVHINGWVDIFIYWVSRFLLAAFWVAIVLGLGKNFLMGILATLQYYKTKKEGLLTNNVGHEKVSIVVPAYNEEVTVIKTINNLLLQDYPDFEIIFVDDGSKDYTYRNVLEEFKDNNRVIIISKNNGGKASALNTGISHASGEYVVCVDADTMLLPDAVRQLMISFSSGNEKNKNITAVAGNVKVGNEKNILTKWQSIEYTTAQNFDRRAFDYLNAITVVPGAIGAFKKSAIIEAGGFTTDTLAEDCDLTIRLLRNGGTVRNCTKAVAITEAPETFRQFMKQRFRWNYGIMQSFWKNKDACFNPRFKALGMVALPNLLLFQLLMTLFAPLADLLFFFSIGWSWDDPESLHKLLLFYGLFLLVDVMVSLIAFSFEKEKIYKLIWLIPQRFVYRQLMYIILFKSIAKAIKGELQGWGSLKRTGNVELIKTPVTNT